MMELAIRALALYVPMVALGIAAVVRRPTRAERNAAVLACIWNVPALAIVHQLAVQAGWWRIQVHGGAQLLGLPIELLVGWMLLWGALPVIALPRVPLPAIVAAAVAFDLLAMPRCAPIVTLGPSWLVGEAVALALCLVPAQLFARWTRDDRHLAARATLQVACFAALTLWLVPTAVFEQVGESWRVLQTYDARWLQIASQLVAIAALPGLSAVQEFVRRGGGTPVPFDPPRRLVTTGIYAYVANPMQLSAALTLFAWGVLLRSWWIAGASTMVIVYGAGFAAWDENRDLAVRFGSAWQHYRRHVRTWRPRWRPYIAPAEHARTVYAPAGHAAAEHVEPGHVPTATIAADAENTMDAEARLYVAFTCSQCSEVGSWLQRQRPRGLRIVPAEQYPTRDLWRMTYAPRDGGVEDVGIAALARALEHIHLGWALAGMFMRLPLVRPCVQMIVDVSGGGPQRIKRVCVPAAKSS
jgi:protein-S-isoprenylcysteine O-methyltransferase Ste14